MELGRPLALAPMEHVTDRAFRRVCKDLGADLVYTEFASSEALIRNAEKTVKKIRVTDDERPVGIQIFGHAEASMERAAALAEQSNPDFIDVNCGCWVRNVALHGAGAGLLKDLGRFEAIVRAVVAGTRLPVTVKTRLGWDAENIVILDVARMLEQCGVQALTVHCRTRDQRLKGKADWSWLERLKGVVSIPIIGNGDVMGPEDAGRMFETGCDGVMIGRGALQNPWIFKQTKHYLTTGARLPGPTLAERTETCLRHLKMAVETKGERRGMLEFRKHYSGYLRELPQIAKLRAELMGFDEVDQVVARLQAYLRQVSDECGETAGMFVEGGGYGVLGGL